MVADGSINHVFITRRKGNDEILCHLEQLLGRREALNKTKQSMKRNDAKQTEERAEMAAQRMVLQQDHELRQAIQYQHGLTGDYNISSEHHALTIKSDATAAQWQAREQRCHLITLAQPFVWTARDAGQLCGATFRCVLREELPPLTYHHPDSRTPRRQWPRIAWVAQLSPTSGGLPAIRAVGHDHLKGTLLLFKSILA